MGLPVQAPRNEIGWADPSGQWYSEPFGMGRRGTPLLSPLPTVQFQRKDAQETSGDFTSQKDGFLQIRNRLIARYAT